MHRDEGEKTRAAPAPHEQLFVVELLEVAVDRYLVVVEVLPDDEPEPLVELGAEVLDDVPEPLVLVLVPLEPEPLVLLEESVDVPEVPLPDVPLEVLVEPVLSAEPELLALELVLPLEPVVELEELPVPEAPLVNAVEVPGRPVALVSDGEPVVLVSLVEGGLVF